MQSHNFIANKWGKVETVTDFIFLGAQIIAHSDCSDEIKKKHLLLGREAMTNLDSILKSKDITNWQRSVSQSYGFSSSHVRMCELDHKDGWAPKNWYFQNVMLETTVESSLDGNEIKAVTSKGNQAFTWIFIKKDCC